MSRRRPAKKIHMRRVDGVSRARLRHCYAVDDAGTEENRVFANSVERAAAARSGDLVERYEPVGCYGDMPTAKEQKLAYREAAKADLKAGRVVRA